MVKFETYIFDELYTVYDKISDPNKDIDDKGTQQRYTEVWGAELDDIVPYVQNMGNNLIKPTSLLESMVAYKEAALGYLPEWIWFYDEPIAFRKYLVGLIPRLYEIRTSRAAYEVMFSWLGIEVEIEEDFVYIGGFDSPLKFDSPLRTLDSYYNMVIDYTVTLTGPVVTWPVIPADPIPATLRIIKAIYTILLFNQHTHIALKEITYNGVVINDYLSYIDPMYLRTNF